MSLIKDCSCFSKFFFYIVKMFKKLFITIIVVLLALNNVYAAQDSGAKDDGGNEGKISKYDKGHKLVLSGKYLEKKADKSLKKGKIKNQKRF